MSESEHGACSGTGSCGGNGSCGGCDTPVAPGTSRVERFLAYLDTFTGGLEPQVTLVATTAPPRPHVLVLSYPQWPAPGVLTAITYGLSDGDSGMPEVVLSGSDVTAESAWQVARLAEAMRGRGALVEGTVLGGDGLPADYLVGADPEALGLPSGLLGLAELSPDPAASDPVVLAGLVATSPTGTAAPR